MSAIEEQGINLLTITNLAEISLFVRDSPICRSHAPALAILESSNIFVARSVLDKRALSVSLIILPVTLVSISVLVCHLASLATLLIAHEWSFIGVSAGADA